MTYTGNQIFCRVYDQIQDQIRFQIRNKIVPQTQNQVDTTIANKMNTLMENRTESRHRPFMPRVVGIRVLAQMREQMRYESRIKKG